MARRAEKTDIEIARQARQSARSKSEGHVGKGNLNANGRPKSAKQLKDEYGMGPSKSLAKVSEDVTGKTTDALNLLKGKAPGPSRERGSKPNKGEALKLGGDLSRPSARNIRPTNKDGASSFHFSHEAISKSSVEKTSARGTKTRKGAAKNHADYLERDSAVAKGVEGEENANPPAPGDEVLKELGIAAKGGLYIEREEALAHQENGVAALYSNISDDARERQRFWDLVEKHETEPNPDHMRIHIARAPEFWEGVKNDPRCPPELHKAIEDCDPAHPYRFRTDNNEDIRALLSEHGWAPRAPRRPDETDAEKLQREQFDAENNKGCEYEDGRGGRIQNRIIGELPHEVTHEQRVRIVRRFAAYFNGKDLPYVAVMHAPDHANNDKNWHFHLAYYERPCHRFTGEEDDHLKPLNANANWRAKAMHEVKAKALKSGELEKYVGEWDFAVKVLHKTKCNHKRETYPFAQEKDRDCNKKDFPLTLRKLLADITNEELMIARSPRRVDPRRYAEMGINKDAEVHMGSRSAQLESLGIATPRGMENEAKQWDWTLDKIEKAFERANNAVEKDRRNWYVSLENAELTGAPKAKAEKDITRWVQISLEANEHKAIFEEIGQHLERAQSRAKKVEMTCTRHLNAIEEERANRRQKNNKANYEARLREAQDHLAGLKVMFASEIEQMAKSLEIQAKLTKEANVLAEDLRTQLKLVPVAPARDESVQAGNDNQANDNLASLKPKAPDRSEADHSLKPAEIERYFKQLVDKNIRLKFDPNNPLYVIPANPTDEDRRVMTARNFVELQSRMMRLKKTQDGLVDEVRNAIMADPKIVKQVRGKDGQPGHELATSNRRLQRAFRSFQDDPQIVAAVEVATERRQSPVQPDRDQATAPVAPKAPAAPTASTDAGKAPWEDSKSDAPRAAPNVPAIRKIDEVDRRVMEIIDTKATKGARFTLAPKDAEQLGLSDKDLAADNVQKRLGGLYRQQKSEISRLVGFVRKSPARLVANSPEIFQTEQTSFTLANTAPPELRKIAQRYVRRPELQKTFSEIYDASIKAAESGKVKAAPVSRTAVEKPRNEPAKARETRPAAAAAPKAGKPASEQATPPDPSPDLEAASRRPAQAPLPLPEVAAEKGSAAANNDTGLDMTKPIQPKAEDRITPSRQADPMDQTKIASRDTKDRAPANAEPQSKAERQPRAPARPAAPVLSAEERAEMLKPRAFSPDATPTVQSVEVKASPAAPTKKREAQPEQPIERGKHPRIDAWVDAATKEARQAAALELKNDRRALHIAASLDDKTKARMRLDWEAQEARNREQAEKTRIENEKNKGTLKGWLQ